MKLSLTSALLVVLTSTSVVLAEEDAYPLVPVSDLQVPEDLEVTVWAKSPMIFNPTNIDTDAAGRIWVAEGVNYRQEIYREEGDRIMVLEDSDGDGTADSSHVFIQDPELIAPLGLSVFDNRVVVAQPPHILVYTDVDRDLRFDPAVDTREEFLSGFNGRNHDHSLHATVAGPDGNWYFNQGNCGARIEDKDGRVFQSGGPYYNQGSGNPEWFNDPTEYAGKPSADGNIYNAGFAGRIRPDGSGLEIVGHGFRNSYELCVSSFGDIFQNDNDDPPACRNTWLMEGGNLGFFSEDGTRLWQMDRRPGQSVQRAHWRQDDPGVIPAGDVHGSGSPTGVTYYENGALPESYEGMFLSCEARARIIQRYHPKLSATGAAVELGGRSNLLESMENLFFRPSDVMVGADGALYVADWYDTKVGGHRAEDPTHSGAIYRIAPKGFQPAIVEPTSDEVEDAVALLKSPAANVRLAGFETLQSKGSEALPAVKALLESESPWFRARAVWLLPHLGDEGMELCRARLEHEDPEQRLLAFRALRAAGSDVLALAEPLVKDESMAVRREIALSLRDADEAAKTPLALELFRTADGTDRHYLEACGLAAQDVESKIWLALDQEAGFASPLEWDEAHAWRSWRLGAEEAVPALIVRAMSESLDLDQRKLALDSMAFIGTQDVVDAIADLAVAEGDLAKDASWWLINRGLTTWAEFGARDLLKERGIYDPETVVVTPVTVPEAPETQLPAPSELAQRQGDPLAGKAQAARCVMCHKVDGVGVEYGPDLTNWVANQGMEAFYEAVIHPSASIAHGYTGRRLVLKDGTEVEGIVYSREDPTVIVSTGGVEQYVPKERIKSAKPMWDKSLMLSADQLGFTAEQLVDLAAYLETVVSD